MATDTIERVGIDALLDSISHLFVDQVDPLLSAVNFTSFLELIRQMNFAGVSESERHVLYVALLLKGSRINEVLRASALPRLTIFSNDIARYLNMSVEPRRPMGVEEWIS